MVFWVVPGSYKKIIPLSDYFSRIADIIGFFNVKKMLHDNLKAFAVLSQKWLRTSELVKNFGVLPFLRHYGKIVCRSLPNCLQKKIAVLPFCRFYGNTAK